MKISELIVKLENMKERVGDIDVATYDDVLEELSSAILCEVARDIDYLNEDEFLVKGDVLLL